MFHALSKSVEPFKPAACRRANWWALRPSGPGAAQQKHQYVSCEGGPSEETSFEDKYRCSVEFWRAWLVQRRPRNLSEMTIRIQLTFRCCATEDGGDQVKLVPESLYPLIALYAVMREAPRVATMKRVVVQLTRQHWLLWKPRFSGSSAEKSILLPLENIVGDITDPLFGLEEEFRDEYFRTKPLIDGCHWVLPTCLQVVLGNFTRWIGIAKDARLLTWFGSSLEELQNGFILLEPF
jgi:hypothetical protein